MDGRQPAEGLAARDAETGPLIGADGVAPQDAGVRPEGRGGLRLAVGAVALSVVSAVLFGTVTSAIRRTGPVAASAPAALSLLEISPQPALKGKGCSNWADVRVEGPIAGMTLQSCADRCKATPRCHWANVEQSTDCEAGHANQVGACYLFTEDCSVEDNGCWDLQASPGPVRDKLNDWGTGCQNWESIAIGDVITDQTLGMCSLKCSLNDECKQFNFQKGSCIGAETAGTCYLFKDGCEKTFNEANECWDLYDSIKGADAMMVPETTLIASETATNAPDATNTSLRVVLYITTHGSEQHMSFLDCRSKHFENLNRLSKADVILYVGEDSETLTNEKKDRYRLLLDAWPVGKKVIHFEGNPGYQSGAMKATHVGFSSGWFDEYDWIIRINPDVFFYDESLLFSLMDEPENWGVFANCDGHSEDHTGYLLHQVENPPQTHTDGYIRAQTHTDFFAVRPEHVAKDAFADWNEPNVNAEQQATRAFRRIFDAKADTYILKENRMRPDCRLRGGGVWHTNGMCLELLKYQPWAPGFCSSCLSGGRRVFEQEACGNCRP